MMCLGRPVWRAVLPLVSARVPRDVAEDSVMHNWPSFSGSLEHCILFHDIQPALAAVNDLPVWLVHGTKDITVPIANVRGLAERFPTVGLAVLDDGDHNMFLNHTEWCLDAIARHSSIQA